ncbi:MAG: Na+/H+ antiporter NhaC family protein [Planctomycetota bacterium]|jgi:Na+/H+ antiporter NhaC
MRIFSGGAWLVAMLLVLLGASERAAGQDASIEVPAVVLVDVPFEVAVTGAADAGLTIRLGEAAYPVTTDADGRLVATDVVAPAAGAVPLELLRDGVVVADLTTRALPGWVSVLPPALAILVALLTRNVIPALFLGIWFGAFALRGFSLGGAFLGLLDSFQVYVLDALADPDHAAIILFTLMIGGMVGIVSRSGGMQGVVNGIAPLARSPQRGQAATGILGILVFFDDYANVLVVGGTMRQITDRLKISREKLAYIVDSTAAPVSCIAFVTTWIGFEVGLIGDAVGQLDGYDQSAYTIFLSSILYSYYPWLALLLVFVVALSGRDFGPMLAAERRARATGQVLRPGADVDDAAAGGESLQPPDEKPHRAINAVLPVLVLVGTVLVGLYVTGRSDDPAVRATQTIRDIIGDADSYKALMWASLLGALTAAVLAIGQRVLTLRQTVDAWYSGSRSMLFALVILLLAWGLSGLTDALQTAPYLVSVLGDALLPALIPAITFVLAAAIAFATGTSWGTMGILMPLVIPLAWAVLQREGMTEPAHWDIIYSTVACTLGGAVWGDHCSPISDTTVLSSLASGSDHIDHVRTQLPYAALVGAVALAAGTVPAGFGVPWWICLGIGAAVLLVAFRFLSRRVDEAAPE